MATNDNATLVEAINSRMLSATHPTGELICSDTREGGGGTAMAA